MSRKIKYDLSRARRKNLWRLAEYLDSLPEDYKRFDMYGFLGEDVGPYPMYFDDPITIEYAKTSELPCGTVACAVGHGPTAGIKFRNEFDSSGGVDWDRYCLRFIPPSHDHPVLPRS